MIKVKKENVVQAGYMYDYELADGTLLDSREWNGEKYIVGHGSQEIEYIPVYDPNENVNGGYDIIGFNRF